MRGWVWVERVNWMMYACVVNWMTHACDVPGCVVGWVEPQKRTVTAIWQLAGMAAQWLTLKLTCLRPTERTAAG